MSDKLQDRGKALVDEFFHKQDEEKLQAMREKLAKQKTASELSSATNIKNDQVLEHLVNAGIDASTLTAVETIPMVECAWASGAVENKEREAVIEGAHAYGVEKGSDAHTMLESWLTRKPSDSLFQAWREYVSELKALLPAEQFDALRTQVLTQAKRVAESAGGILGIGSISGDEKRVLESIEEAFQ